MPGDPAGDAAITFADAGKQFDGAWVVEHLDLEVPRGKIFGLIGPSGCGKTTTVRLANGVYRPDAGEVFMLGRASSEMRARERAAIGYLPQQPALFEQLSLRENLNFHASLNGVRLRRKQRLAEVLDLVELGEHDDKLVRESSGGMRRRLALAATLVHRPAVLLLDEPTAGIDPILRRRFWEHFRTLADAGHTFVITTQHVDEAAGCDVVGLLADGRLAAVGSPEELRRRAVGGELIEVETDRAVDGATGAELAAAVGADRFEYLGPQCMRFVVSDAGSSLPVMLQQLERRGITTRNATQAVPAYDEVFINLVHEARDSAA